MQDLSINYFHQNSFPFREYFYPEYHSIKFIWLHLIKVIQILYISLYFWKEIQQIQVQKLQSIPLVPPHSKLRVHTRSHRGTSTGRHCPLTPPSKDPHDSKAAIPTLWPPSHCEKDKDSQETLQEVSGGVRRDELQQDTCTIVISSSAS